MRRPQLTSSRPYQRLVRSELGRRGRRLARQAPLLTTKVRFLLEWEILRDRRLATCSPRAIVLEYHAARCPEADPRRTVQGVLHRAGYRTLNGAAPDSTAAQGILWALRDGDAPPPDGPEPERSDGPAQDDAGG
jgi:hypothetical protein